MEVLIRHHDILRMGFKRNSNGNWEQFNKDIVGGFYILEENTLDENEDRNFFFELNSNVLIPR